MFIYLVENLLNGKRYVGQTTFDLASRWRDHVYKFKNPYPKESWTPERRAAQSVRARNQGLKSNNLFKGEVT
jgi:hypothetical protein